MDKDSNGTIFGSIVIDDKNGCVWGNLGGRMYNVPQNVDGTFSRNFDDWCDVDDQFAARAAMKNSDWSPSG